MLKNRDMLIALEGIDGCGKSTQAHRLQTKLESLGYKVHLTSEPTDMPIGRYIRSIFAGKEQATQHTISALFLADRLQHILDPVQGMIQKLAEGYIVITDRYYLSSLAYHSVYVSMEWVMQCNDEAARLLRPNLYLYLDLSPDISLDRIRQSRSSTEMYETLDTLKSVHHNYMRAIQLLSPTENIVTIDANQEVDIISAEIWSICFPLVQNSQA